MFCTKQEDNTFLLAHIIHIIRISVDVEYEIWPRCWKWIFWW